MEVKTQIRPVTTYRSLWWVRLIRSCLLILLVIPIWYFVARSYCGNGRTVAKTFLCDVPDNGCGYGADQRNCSKDWEMNITKNIPVKLEHEAVIQSPNFTRPYPPDLNMLWNVTTAPGYRIKVVFTIFELKDSEDCGMDFLTLHDGVDLYSPVLGTFCRHGEGSLPEPITSSSNSLVIHFRSDQSLEWKGFELALVTVCGGTLQAQASGNVLVLQPKYGRGGYASNLTCDWIIMSRPERIVQIRFSDLDMAKPSLKNDNEGLPKKIESSGCENSINGKCVQYYERSETGGTKDFVEIFDGLDDSSTSFGKYYSNQMAPTVIVRGGLLVRYSSGGGGRHRGFRAVYNEV